MFQFLNKLKMCLHFDQIRTLHRYLKLAFFGLNIYSILAESVKAVPSGKAMIEKKITTTDHLQHFRADKLSAFFKSEAPFYVVLSRLVSLNSFKYVAQKRCNTSKGFHALFIACDRQMILIFRYSCVPFFHFFVQILNYVSLGSCNKTIILHRLAEYQMIITRCCASCCMVINRFISIAPSRNNC